MLVTLVHAPLYHVLIPLGDSQTMVAVVRERLDYGRIRLWGSATFIAGIFGGGWLLTDRSPDVIVPAVFAGLVLVFLTTLWLREQNAPTREARHGGLRNLLTDRVFLLFVLAVSAVQASHAVLNGFSIIHWRAAGLSGTAISLLWAGSVLAEIVLFAVSGAAIRHLGPFGLLAIGAGAGPVRRIILAETIALPGLVVVQILHAATFGATYLATMHFIAAHTRGSEGHGPGGLCLHRGHRDGLLFFIGRTSLWRARR